jgi:lipopolysaccharide transport system permease protein
MVASRIKAIWSYRGFIAGSVKREIQARYRSSLLGAFWIVANPIASIVIYTVIFSEIMHTRLPGVDLKFAYSIYLCSGILTWNFFIEVVSRCQTVFIEHGNLLKKLSFPRICLPVVVVASSSFNFAVIFAIFLFFLLLSGSWPGLPLIAFFVVLGLQIMMATGLGILLGVLNVFFRDVGHLFGIALQFWFWATPIVYPLGILSDRIRPWVELNPLTPLMSAYQQIFTQGQWPHWQSLIPSAILALLLCLCAWMLFQRRGSEMVDEL